MTNNPTIDGVSRATIEQALLDAQRVRFPTDKHICNLRALIDAPVVERQPVACGQCGSTSADICNGNGCGYLESGNGEPEIAALQSTIAQLQARVQELEIGLGGMLFAFDDGVGRGWSAKILDYARKLTPAVEFDATAALNEVKP